MTLNRIDTSQGFLSRKEDIRQKQNGAYPGSSLLQNHSKNSDDSRNPEIELSRHTNIRERTVVDTASSKEAPTLPLVYEETRPFPDESDSRAFPRISKDVEFMSNSYDCVVVGSGYGGAVAASRTARAGQRVCLLERGREKWPGEYPCDLNDVMKEFHVSGEFTPSMLKGTLVKGGDPTGLYHLICGKGQNTFVGNGLGGTSLLNANIFLEADDKTLSMNCWPEELKRKDALKKYYERAAAVLEPEPYPHDWPKLAKLKMLQRQAKALGWEERFKRPRQTTRFRDGPNSTGVMMRSSSLTGMDSTGINDGSKSSTLVNYLADAWNWGTEMFCQCEVRYVKKCSDTRGGYLVFFAWHGSCRKAFQSNFYEDLMWVHAKKCVFLGAGSIGTTEILLRSKSLGLSMSSKVGTEMTGNGDILAFAYNTDTEVNAIGHQHCSPYKPVGPTITGLIDCRNQENPLDGFVIQEGAVPKSLSSFLQNMLETLPESQPPKGQSLLEKVRRALAQIGSRLLGPYYPSGSIEKTQVYLIMSHDSNQATLTLKNDEISIESFGAGNSERSHYLYNVLKEATRVVKGTFVNNPFYAAMGQQEITVHPIGGACMSRNGTGQYGATTQYGEVFDGQGKKIHEGLFVTDGAIIPTALGVNPYATITALAERSVEYAVNNRIGAEIDLETRNDTLNLFHEPYQFSEAKEPLKSPRTNKKDAISCIKEAQAACRGGVEFSEIMSGYIHAGEEIKNEKIENYDSAAKIAKGLCEEARLFLSVKTWDTASVVHRPNHEAMLTGSFSCSAIKGGPFMVRRGTFRMLNVNQQAAGMKNITYSFDMTSIYGKKYHFYGFKVIDTSITLAPRNFWRAMSTLYVYITEATGENQLVGCGILHIAASDFLSQMLSFKPIGSGPITKIQSICSFLSFFAKQSACIFFAPLTWLQYPLITFTGYINDTPPDTTIEVIAEDGVSTLMHIWEPRNSGIKPINIFLIPGASVDHQIFSLPTIEVNTVNYFTRAGYRVHVTVHRICMLEVAKYNWTTFDARLDIKACLELIRMEHGPEKIYTVAHCMGAVAFSSGLLDGTIPTSWIKGISCSQVFMNPIWTMLNNIKFLAGYMPIDKIYSLFGGRWFSCMSTKDDTYFQQLINQLLRFYPENRGEICNNISCHRCSLIFGRLWCHRNLNEATHRQIDRFFGGINMTCLHLLMQMGKRGFVTSNKPCYTRLTTEGNLRRLKGIPIMVFSGSENQVLSPAATEQTYSILRNRFGPENYERHVIHGYGHLDCWMGREAYVDVFPVVRDHADKICRGQDYSYVEPNWRCDWNTWKNS
ncbi:hypothetical protein K3495_g2408 [Podosphaera aphanis]|nr:hypothetical protein K3495_g2408 [Podosphaera aphanis]